MKQVINLLKKHTDISDEIQELENILKYKKKQREQFAERMCDFFQENQLKEIETSKGKIKAFYGQKFTILGGKKQTDQRTKVISLLEKLGFAEKVQTYKEMDERLLQKAIKSLPVKTLQNLVKEKLISIHDFARVVVTKGKK